MKEYRAILKQVGLALIVVGLFDIAYAAYCIVHMQSYSSSLNLLAVIADIFLLRGNLAATRKITWMAAFLRDMWIELNGCNSSGG